MSFWMAQMHFFNKKNYIYAILWEHQENTRRCSSIPLENIWRDLFQIHKKFKEQKFIFKKWWSDLKSCVDSRIYETFTFVFNVFIYLHRYVWIDFLKFCSVLEMNGLLTIIYFKAQERVLIFSRLIYYYHII
jgi:hypothetical protein